VKKIIVGILILFTGLFISPSLSSANNEGQGYTQNFVISAYYSPLPGQSRYATGTYAGDIRLNGNGVHTADGTAVESMTGGFVAAPSTFGFGTKMDIEGLGMFTVHDRGGAIKGSRLDVWMGYGDEGLMNALTWGKRTVSVTVYMDRPDLVDNNSIVSNYTELEDYQKVTVDSPLDFDKEITVDDEGEDVARLQQFLKDLGYFNGKVNGVFNQLTEKALIDFQKDKGLIRDASYNERGKLGGRTVLVLQEAVRTGKEEYLEDVPSRNLGRGASGDDVSRLQEILVRLGYLEKVNGVYDQKTVDAVYQFQLTSKLVEVDTDTGAGYFGPATQLAMTQLHLQLELGMQEVINSTQSLEKFAVNLVDENLEYLLVDDKIKFNLSEGDEGLDVYNLQIALRDLNFLRVDPSGYFGPLTQHAVMKFQMKVNLIETEDDVVAGKVGPQTRKALNSFLNVKAKVLSIKKSSSKTEISRLIQEKKLLETASVGDHGKTVKRLQSFLQKTGHYKSQFTTEYFGDVTRQALLEYQLDADLIVASDDAEAGILNIETLEFINAAL